MVYWNWKYITESTVTFSYFFVQHVNKKAYTTLTVYIKDEDDMDPAFTQSVYVLKVQEEVLFFKCKDLTYCRLGATGACSLDLHTLSISHLQLANKNCDFFFQNSSFAKEWLTTIPPIHAEDRDAGEGRQNLTYSLTGTLWIDPQNAFIKLCRT